MKKMTWNKWDMVDFCIENDLYTGGDNQHYSMMLDFVATHPATEENIRLVATDIASHSYWPDGRPYSIFTDDVQALYDHMILNVIG